MPQQSVIVGSGWTNQVRATGSGELIVTGSVFRIPTDQVKDVLIERDTNQLLTELLKEAKIINFQLMTMNNLQIKNQDIDI